MRVFYYTILAKVGNELSAPNRPGESLTDCLSCKAFHLDVEELSEVAEPFNHLGGHTSVKLVDRNIGKTQEKISSSPICCNICGNHLYGEDSDTVICRRVTNKFKV